RRFAAEAESRRACLRLSASVPGNGLCAFITPSIDVVVEGGSQDGAAKGAFGGFLGVFKGRNREGMRVDGSTGKSFAYGAIRGCLMVQNLADSRASIRMSGADVVFGGRLTTPLRDEEGNLASRAHLKGFAFEYMTGGRAVVLGDPGPWICAGMTGGVIYQCLYPELGLDEAALTRRLARGANVFIEPLTDQGAADIGELLARYIRELEQGFQPEEAAAVAALLAQARERFVMIVPKALKPASAE
ncbi:MAG: glutamate synthase, partial [Thermodesulfobacteriota bacterium]